MTKIQDILNETSWGDAASMANAMQRMKKLPDHELHFYLVMRDTLNATTADTRKGITLAQAEFDRRAQVERRRLTVMTTLFSGVVGIAGVILGAWLTDAMKDDQVHIKSMPEVKISAPQSEEAPAPKLDSSRKSQQPQTGSK